MSKNLGVVIVGAVTSDEAVDHTVQLISANRWSL